MINRQSLTYFCAIAVTFSLSYSAAAAETNAEDFPTTPRLAENVILITADGLRWQEVFRGIDADMVTTENLVKSPEAMLAEYDAETTEARRQKLMPFLWDTVARQGQIYGNRDVGSIARVTNKFWFSYPGYNEFLVGYADDERITSNRKLPNPNVTVFEWLGRKPSINGSVAAFGAWDVFPYIFNTGRCGFPVDGGERPFVPKTGVTCGMEMINSIRQTTPLVLSATFDSLVYPVFTEYLKDQKPRVMYLGLGETDEWGHRGDYEKYILAANRVDGWLQETWDLLQSIPQYRDKTTIIFTSDHGRGDSAQSPTAWKSHSREFPGSDSIFFAVWGPDTPPMGEVQGGPEVTQAQVAATVAAALGFDYVADQPKAAPPVTGAFHQPAQ